MALELGEIALRLGLAAISGMLIGIDRDSREKPAGMRTLSLVALGAALISVTAVSIPEIADHVDAISRVSQGAVQGIVAGIGFIGAGAIIRRGGHNEVVHGVTTAATVWVAAAMGMACGFGEYRPVAIALVLVFVILLAAKPLEKVLLRDYERRSRAEAGSDIDGQRQQDRVEDE